MCPERCSFKEPISYILHRPAPSSLIQYVESAASLLRLTCEKAAVDKQNPIHVAQVLMYLFMGFDIIDS